MSDFARRKKYAWIALASGVGGTLVFVLWCSFEGPPGLYEIKIYLWPICTSAAVATSALLLKKYYREEPENFAGFWHLSIVDLFSTSIIAAALMAAWRAVWPLSFVPAGIAVALSLATAFVFCLLISARKGFQRPLAKITKALSVLLISLSWMAVGTLAVLFAVILCYDQRLDDAVEFLVDVFGNFTRSYDKNDWLLFSLRIGMLCLPIGYAFGAFSHFLVSPKK